MEKYYIVVIGDIVKSSKVEASVRLEMQEQLSQTLLEINQTYEEYLISKFTITIGDEFQGLLRCDAPFMLIIEMLRLKLGIAIRLGIGVGELYTEIKNINTELNIGNDGPAYWAAREAINFVHDTNDYGVTNVCLRAKKEGIPIDLINHLLRMGEVLRNKWTTSQKDFVQGALAYMYTSNERVLQKKLADFLGISSQQVSNSMKNTAFFQYQANCQLIESSVHDEIGDTYGKE